MYFFWIICAISCFSSCTMDVMLVVCSLIFNTPLQYEICEFSATPHARATVLQCTRLEARKSVKGV